MDEGNEDLEVVDAGRLGHVGHLSPILHKILLLGNVPASLLHLRHHGSVSGILVEILHLLRLLRGAEGGLEDGDSDDRGDGSESGPPGKTRVDVDVLGKPLHCRGNAPAIVEAEGFEETDLFGEVEKIAAGKLDGGRGESIDGRGSGSGSGGGGGIGDGGSGIRTGRGVADLAKRREELVGSGGSSSDAERSSYPAGALGERSAQRELSRRRGLERLCAKNGVSRSSASGNGQEE